MKSLYECFFYVIITLIFAALIAECSYKVARFHQENIEQIKKQ